MQKSRNNNGSTNKKSIKKNYQKEQQNSKDCNTAKAGKSSFNWYPGHMTKAKRMMEENIRLIDLVIEIVDARVPMSSRNPDIDKLASNKARIILLNKADLADDYVTNKWIAYFNSKNIYCLKLNSRDNSGVKQVNNLIQTACADKIERDKSRGIMNRTIKAMVVGIPNVGKSTFINRLSKASKATTENRPGVTRSNQWIMVDKELELLDTPGVLWPKFDDRTVGEHLAFTGAVKDDIVDPEDLAVRLIECIKQNEMKKLTARYGIEFDVDSYEMLCSIAKKRGMMIKGGEADTLRAAKTLLEEFKNCKIGRISLEHPEM